MPDPDICECGHPKRSHIDGVGECFSEGYTLGYECKIQDCMCDKFVAETETEQIIIDAINKTLEKFTETT